MPDDCEAVETCRECRQASTSDVRGLSAFRLVLRKGGGYGCVCAGCAEQLRVGVRGTMLQLIRRTACQK